MECVIWSNDLNVLNLVEYRLQPNQLCRRPLAYQDSETVRYSPDRRDPVLHHHLRLNTVVLVWLLLQRHLRQGLIFVLRRGFVRGTNSRVEFERLRLRRFRFRHEN